MTETEWQLCLARMAQAALRRVTEDQLAGLARLWHHETRGLHPVGVDRAVQAFLLDGKLPTLREFRQRARDLEPADPVTDPVPAADRCQMGHVFVPRQFYNSGGRLLGARPYCPCMDEATAVYGCRWGAEVSV